MTTYEVPHFGLARQYSELKDELLEATDLAMRDGTFIGGEYTVMFEEWLKERTGCEYATVVHSGTQALELLAAYHADVSFLAGEEEAPTVLIPNLTYPATFNAFYSAGYDVELVDVDKNGLILMNRDTEFNMYRCFVGFAGGNPNYVFTSVDIVDGAQHWLSVKGEYQTGSGMAISFDPTKNLPSSGNGGAIVTNDPTLYQQAVSFKNNGKPDHFYPGTNSKMSELECAHMMVRTRYINDWQFRRFQIRQYYLDQFKDLPIRCLSRDFNNHADQKFVIYTDRRDDLHKFLLDQGIEARIHYPQALSELPITRDIKVKPDMLSTSVMLTRGVLSLPIYPELLDTEVEYIANCVKKFYGSYH